MVTIETARVINNMADTCKGEALQGILRASETFHTHTLDLSKRDIDELPEDFPILQDLLVSPPEFLLRFNLVGCRVFILRATVWLRFPKIFH